MVGPAIFTFVFVGAAVLALLGGLRLFFTDYLPYIFVTAGFVIGGWIIFKLFR